MVAIGNNLLAIILAGILIGLQTGNVLGQNCSCAADLCCSRWGYCGTGDDYCGRGCQKGPCNPLPSTNNVSVANIVTPEFFNHITDQATGDCPGKNFYSRSAFLQALNSYPQFGRVGSLNDSKREIAAFFGHVTLETSRKYDQLAVDFRSYIIVGRYLCYKQYVILMVQPMDLSLLRWVITKIVHQLFLAA